MDIQALLNHTYYLLYQSPAYSIMSDQPVKKRRLAAAAEALIDAASLEVDSMTQKRLASNLDSLKTSFDNKLNTVVQAVQTSNENFDAKIDKLNQHVAGLKSEVSAIKTLLEEEKKQKTLERALGMTHFGSFNYYICNMNGYNSYNEKKPSSELVKSILQRFSLGFGFTLPLGAPTDDPKLSRGNESEKKALHKAIAVKFVKQIKDLIKRKPRLVDKNDGTFEINYE